MLTEIKSLEDITQASDLVITEEKVDALVKISIDTVDPEIYKLLTYINRVKGIRTTDSCFGHNERPCSIYCEADSIATVQKFMHDYFYGNHLWSIALYITDEFIDNDQWGKVRFQIKSDDRYVDYPTLNLLVTNLTEKFWKYQNCAEYFSWLLLPVDNSIKLEDAITEVITEEFSHSENEGDTE